MSDHCGSGCAEGLDTGAGARSTVLLINAAMSAGELGVNLHGPSNGASALTP